MLIIWGIAVFMGILTVVLLMGKGSFLIAGYNTSSKEEKQEYDEKKLCRVVGGGMGVITLMLIGWGFMGEKFPVSVFLIVTIVTVIIIQILSNTICRAQANDGSVQKKKNSRRQDLHVWFFSVHRSHFGRSYFYAFYRSCNPGHA